MADIETMEDESFGTDEAFGDSGEAAFEAAPESTSAPADALNAVLDEALSNYEAAVLMNDEIGKARFQKIIDTCKAQLEPPTAPQESPAEDWQFLEDACVKAWGEEAGKKWLQACRDQGCKYATIYNDVAPHLGLEKIANIGETEKKDEPAKEKTTRKPRQKAEKKETVAEPEAPQENKVKTMTAEQAQVKEVVDYATKEGVIDAHLIWDEIELGELTQPNITAFSLEIARRIQALREGFGNEQPATESAGIKQTESAPQETQQDWLDKRTDQETGEIDLPGLLKAYGWVEFPKELTLQDAEKIIDSIARPRRQAKFEREQAEKRAAKYDKKANGKEELFGKLLDQFFEKYQPKKGDGSFDGKTMELRTGTLSYKGSNGGFDIANEFEFHKWLKSADKETREKYSIQLEYTITADEAIALGIADKLKEMDRQPDYEYDRKKLLAKINAKKKEEQLAPVPGMIKTVPQPLLKRTIE